ncbi:hypothetical protein [Natronolimnohabitans innermongolicus]|nr:hypothetical protein [Natronolimnohabitans innermongolicus]
MHRPTSILIRRRTVDTVERLEIVTVLSFVLVIALLIALLYTATRR